MIILGLCGSLRMNSSNGFILKAAKRELNSFTWVGFNLADLPYFDPDNQYSDQIPEKVLEVRKIATAADFIFIATPEYARGIPGILKNAFEWIFHEGTQKKPVYVVIGSSMGQSTKAQLIEVLSTMDFNISENQVYLFHGARSKIDADGNILDHDMSMAFKQFCHRLIAHGKF